jgi:TolB-like protein/Flp pilus assembly protein TadD/predicted Ser/Thr protein kinase
MTTAATVCAKCGAKIFADAPEGLCTACLFEAGLGLLAQPSVAAGDSSAVASAKADDCGSVENVDSSDANTASHVKQAPRPAKTFADFGDYELLEEIGRGGQGVVYRAHQKSLNRTVALKVIGLGHWATEAHLKRFRREAEAAASLEHPGIVPIHEVGERDGSCYFSMKFVEGGQLDEVVRRTPMSVPRAAELIAKIARTVHYAHEHGILHRDIKPGNILLDRKGEPHLTDFGLARLVETESTVTRTLEVLGTPSYMAPEQAVGNNAQLTSATDVYGLGAVLYQLLTGHPPFAGGTTFETIRLLLDTEPRPPRLWNPKVDRDVSTICLKCLDKGPRRRYSSALALAEDLERWLKHEPISARRTGLVTRGRKWVRRNPTSALLAASLVALAAAAGWIIWKSEFIRQPVTTGIAVLPFANLSDEKEHAFFADGVQDDILIKLAKIADLKVISRTSVMQYRGKQDVRQIGDALRVSHVLEGTVRRTGGKVHINAQLVDTRTDAGIWAEEYDRDLNGVFAIETEVAQSIANRLRAKVSAREKAAIQEWPTKDLVAYDLYARAKNILEAPGSTQKELLQAVDLLDQAVARDPSFFDAYCQLAYAHNDVYHQYVDHTSARLALAEAAIQAAARLRPDAGETHLARARNLYWGYWDYDGALAELKIAHQTLPNDFRIPQWTAYIQNRQGHWKEATRNLERAIELNPRNMETRVNIAMHYTSLRRYADLKSALASTLAVFPNDLDTRIWPAYAEFQEKADTRPLHQMLDLIRATNPAAMRAIAEWPLACALAERDATAVKNALDAHSEDPIDLGLEVFFNRSFAEGLIALIKKDEGKARSAFVAARAEQEKVLQAQHDNNGLELSLLGLIDAYLGRKEEALREGRRAVELVRGEKDVMQEKSLVTNLAMIAACVGDKDLAFEELDSIIRLPSPLSYGGLKLFPWWDPLRGDPRFEKILEEAKQPVVVK